MTKDKNSVMFPTRREFLRNSSMLAAATGMGGLGSFMATPAFAGQ